MSLPAIRADDIPLTKSTLRFCSYVALGILVVWHLSWRLGQEVLMLTPTTLRYWRKLGPFRRKAESEWRHISVIEAADPKKHPDAPGVHMELRTDPALEPEYAFFGRNIHNHDLPTIIAILQAYHRRSAPHRYEDETAVR